MNDKLLEAAPRFTFFSRILHWAMAAMVIAMLFIGAAMVVSLDHYHLLLSIHRPLGILILILVVVRFVNRLMHRPPPYPQTMRRLERAVAKGSEYLLYTLVLVQPLIGWGMLSAAGNPVVLYGPLHLPAIAPHSTTLYATLRETHTIVAYLLFLTFVAHLCAVLFHALVLRDKILDRMAFRAVTRSKD